MRRHLTIHRSPVWSALLALVAACFILVVPGKTSAENAEAALLAVGAISLLAGHRWGLLVMLAAHTALAARLVPVMFDPQLPGETGAAIGLVLASLVPTVAWSAALLPRLVHDLWPEGSARARTAGMVLTVALITASAIAPLLTSKAGEAGHRPGRTQSRVEVASR
jgi:hypothetical protein